MSHVSIKVKKLNYIIEIEGENHLRILVLTGSPHKNGTTSFLADEFCEGARESGHDGVKAHYKCLCKYLKWQESGTLLACGLANKQDAENSQYKELAKKFGKEIN